MVVVDFNTLAWFSYFQVTLVEQANPQAVVNQLDQYCKLYENELWEGNILFRVL